MIMSMAKNIKDQPDQKLKTAAILAFIPPTGILGIHNFTLKQYFIGAIHLIIVAASVIPYFTIKSSCGHEYSCNEMVIFTQFLQVAVRFIEVSYIWAIIEGIYFLKLRAKSRASTLSPAEIAEEQKQKTHDRKICVIISSILTIHTILIDASLIKEIFYDRYLAASAALFLSFVPLIVYAAISIIFSIIGIKTDLKWLSIINIIINTLSVVCVATSLAYFFLST